MRIKWTFDLESRTCNVFDSLAICFENKAIGGGDVHSRGMILQRLVAHSARHRVADLVRHHTKGANKRRMARSALASLIEAEQPRTSSLQTLLPDLQTGRQAIETKRC
jgi:hypothetical protein